MEYEILHLNDNQTARVKMTIEDHVLEQDFPVGSSQQELETAILTGLAVFHAETQARIAEAQVVYEPEISGPVVIQEEDLPPIAIEDEETDAS